MNIIKPKILKGFRDFMPDSAAKRRHLFNVFEETFKSFGYKPIETPALEYSEILLGKGSDEADKQLFRFETAGGKDVALRFDLTVPLARYVAQYDRELPKPFRRYQIAPVWRGENPQRGRFREFTQCDFDILGSDSISADAEIIAIIAACMKGAGAEVKISVNNRKYLAELLSKYNAPQVETLRALDKLKKLGDKVVVKELNEKTGLSAAQAEELLSELTDGSGELSDKCSCHEELETLAREVERYNVSCHLDLTLARGLDYYTATVFETTLISDPEIGSVCSGGRYDNLTGVYSRTVVPGVGASIGIDRLLASIEDQMSIETRSAYLISSDRGYGIEIATRLREQGLNVAIALDDTRLGNHLKKADRLGVKYAIIIGEDEVSSGSVTVKDLSSGEQTTLKKEELSKICP